MSVFSDPHPYSVKRRYQLPTKVNNTTYDFPLYGEGHDYLYHILFNTHPLLINRVRDVDRYRLSTADIDYAQLIVNNCIVSTIRNYNSRGEVEVHPSEIGGVFSNHIDFSPNNPIPVGLLDCHPVLRVVFWREPLAPVWISYTLANSSTWFKDCYGRPFRIYDVWSNEGQVLRYQNGTVKNVRYY